MDVAGKCELKWQEKVMAMGQKSGWQITIWRASKRLSLNQFLKEWRRLLAIKDVIIHQILTSKFVVSSQLNFSLFYSIFY